MRKYIGTKTIEAEPMLKGEAYEKGLLRTLSLDESEKRNPGYHVRYEDGYESWSPAGVFNASYNPCDDFADRLKIEMDELKSKIEKLAKFIEGDEYKILDECIQANMRAQIRLMREYLYTLMNRWDNIIDGKSAFTGFSFGVAIELLNKGFALRRSGWNEKYLSVIKQVPGDTEKEVMRNIQSLPKPSKERILRSNGFVLSAAQCIIINEITWQSDRWVPSISDVFAQDWEVAKTR